jgi:hypothetical protein
MWLEASRLINCLMRYTIHAIPTSTKLAVDYGYYENGNLIFDKNG